MAAEIRLWEALERQLLVPFQYFGVHDNTELTRVKWSGGKYNATELTNLYTGDHARVALILREIEDKIARPHQMRGLGFCVSIDHAEFMADQFNKAGLSALALTSNSPDSDRKTAKHRLVRGELQVIFTVDLFNEGVDIPEADTVLFLRPTESATIFLQQLGRGLRHAPGKSCLTVLDFIGHAHKRFRYDVRYRALTGASRRELAESLEEGFPYLPAGCSIALDKVATEHVLENIQTAVGSSMRTVVDELSSYGERHVAVRTQLVDDRAKHRTYPLDGEMGWEHEVPLSVHARYSLSEIRAAFGLLTPRASSPIREGVRYLEDLKTDLFFVTLEKTEKHYSPQTMYRDYAISRELFHWESQWNTSPDTPTGRRYIEHGARGTNVLLFVRRHKKISGQTQPYTLLGAADYVRHEGEKPMAITWRLRRPMPSDLFLDAKVVAG